MAELDEGIGNLEAFNSLVGDTSTRLTSDTGALESQARTIDGLESDAQAAFDGLDDRLEELHARLDDERSQAGDAVDGVADLGGELSDDRLPAAQDTLEETGRTIDEGLDATADEIEGGMADLKADGFEASATEAEALAADTEAASGETEGAFSALAAGVSAAEQQVESAESSAQDAASGFAGAVSGQEAGAQAVETLATVLGDSGSELSAAAETLAGDLSEAYTELGEAAESEAGTMKDEIGGVLDHAAQHVADEAAAPVEALLDANVDDALPALATATDMAAVVLEAGAAVTEQCEQLVPELATSQSKVDEIDKLLNVL
jgi:chromosome segregation ATPase